MATRRRIQGISYGQKRPPLTHILQSILERYPDGGQILKEIIQNADDAGASKVAFLLDSRSDFYGKESLYEPTLAQFQGPALYAQNNARFEDSDWENLERLMRSSKKDDPLKVGRFGIGFNSVYHMTDLPSIVSGDSVAFLDPHEIHFGRNETGQQFSLKEPLIEEYRDQFLPYENVLDCKISSTYYNGTLFRFPLRSQPSELSKKKYPPEKVRNLFEALKKEASVILLFLKNVQEISLFETDETNRERRLFIVCLSDSFNEVQMKKKHLLSQVQLVNQGNITHIQMSLSVRIQECGASKRVENEWLVYHQIDARDADIRELASELGLLPWVSVAAPLSELNRHALPSGGGRIFCFLPLPPDSDVKTGFPVHIHGYFGLTDNRRGLKWPGLDCMNDSTADWNVLLLEKVGSKAYANMLETLASRYPEAGSAIAAMVYSSWPNPSEVDHNWQRTLKPMISDLRAKQVFWTSRNGGQWVRLEEALLDTLKRAYPSLSSSIRDVILATLKQANEPVVSVPAHVMKVIDYMRVPTSTITPAFMRSLLKIGMKGSWYVANMSREEKFLLLEFVLQDENLNDMQGVPLLPLADGSFVDFRPLSYRKEPHAVYVSSPKHPRSLFHRLDKRFLDDRRDCKALHYLTLAACDVERISKQKPTQLVKLNTNIALDFLREMLPDEWYQAAVKAPWSPGKKKHPPESWLAGLWKWIREHFAENLFTFEGLPLIPHTRDGKQSILKLKVPTVVVRQCLEGQTLPAEIVSLLQKVGCIVLTTLPTYVNHPALHEYIATPNPGGVLAVMKALGWETCSRMIPFCLPEEKKALRGYLSRLPTMLSIDDKNLLRHLPIFDAADGCSFIAVTDNFTTRRVAPFLFKLPQGLPIPNASQVVSLADYESLTLIQRVGISVMTSATFLVSNVFPGISSFYNYSQVSTLMCWVLKQYYVLCNEESSFAVSLKQLSFVPVESGRLVMPCELYDPEEPHLRGLFEGESDKFPAKGFLQSDILSVLKCLGMRVVPTAKDIAMTARGLHKFEGAAASRKALALFDFLDRNCSFLELQTSLIQALMEANWIIRKTDRPTSYPDGIPYFNSKKRFFMPSEVRAQSKAYLVGGSMPLISKSCCRELEGIFGWDKAPVNNVLEQLRLAASTTNVTAIRGRERDCMKTMLKQIYYELSKQRYSSTVISSLRDDSFPPWVWCEDGFSPPSQVAFASPLRLDLKPYYFVLSSDYKDKELRDFFEAFGAREKLDESDLLRVLGMIKDDKGKDPSDRLRLAVTILQWMVRDEKPLPQPLREKLLVPVITSDSSVSLVPCCECTFCDAEWLKKGGFELPITSQFSMIHDTIPPKTAKLLGVPPISTRLTCAEALGIEQAGPYEPVTTRIKNILNEYKEGAGVFKELIQNADDAGATEVTFVLDWRSHLSEKLLSPGMADCQGPALLVYNNSVFSDDDFNNITKLAGATKREDLEKIGRFGLGFNSVYHITDVPSFISRMYVVFFDPNTSYLGRHIENPSKPGIKINLEMNPTPLLYFPDQFVPFHGLFGCNTVLQSNSANSTFHFHGTLFRFAFRTKPSAISRKIYDERDIQSLIHSFQESSPNLLLFTQNVKKVSLLEIKAGTQFESPPAVLLEVFKERVSVIHSNKSTLKGETFLHSCASWTRGECEKPTSKERAPPPENTELVSVTCRRTNKSGNLTSKDSWLIASSLGSGSSFQLATSDEGRAQGLLSSSDVAAKVSHENDIGGVLKPKSIPGEAFCFLPLSIPTGLPVHVNGYFAVTSNRRGIWEKTTTDSDPLEVRWNVRLMEDAVSKTYFQLLHHLRQLQQQGKVSLSQNFVLWPDPASLQSTAWKPLVLSIYRKIADSDLPIIWSGEKWLSVGSGIYSDVTLKDVPGSHQILKFFGKTVVDLPRFVRDGFKLAGCGDFIDKRTMTKQKFLEDIFFPDIGGTPRNLRDSVVCYIIDECLRGSQRQSEGIHAFYTRMLQTTPCIPCAPDKDDLALPKDLVNPNGPAASLFDPEDKRFPTGQCYCTKERLLVLERFGMMSSTLDWDILRERAFSVHSLLERGDHHALKRIRSLVGYLNNHLQTMKPPSDFIKKTLQASEMFPVLPKPAEYTMTWKGPQCGSEGLCLLSAEELYEEKYKYVAGASKRILDETSESGCGTLVRETRDIFAFSGRKPTFLEALHQLDEAIACAPRLCIVSDFVQNVCYEIYDFLQSILSRPEGKEIADKLSSSSWILVEGKFLSPSQLAFVWKGTGEPFLYQVPSALAEKYRSLLEAARVKQRFHHTDFIDALKKVKIEKRGNPLTNKEFTVVRCFLNELLDVDKGRLVGVPLPDVDQILHDADQLAINDAPWVKALGDTSYVHSYIPIELAYKLGATDIRSKKLGRISRPIGEPFGQREQLTDRLRGILKSYPFDVGILKELVQNADDAGATEIHFIYDPRYHPTKHLLSDSWKELQGPALCVYNNRPFSEADLEGIQRLGIGSKAEDPTKTGQYGIGFNAVYHLTDCPSFISNGDTLCVLDPHCRYAPGATPENPGRLIGPLREEERSDFRDIFPCYLETFFDLTSATMFRLPLRNEKMSANSKISEKEVDNSKMTMFMNTFGVEAKEILLFLNHVSKITLSKIVDDQLKEVYSVSVHLSDKDIGNRTRLSNYIREARALETIQIELLGITYPLAVDDTVRKETWLVHQCIGLHATDDNDVIPNGQPYGLLPRGGVALKVSEEAKISSKSTYKRREEPKGKAFCFLPLPVNTGLPVHINGHFYLDSARRDLWRDENNDGFGSKWNEFIMTKVVAQAYVSILLEARHFVPYLEKVNVPCFTKEYFLHIGMQWYHHLFPRKSRVKSNWMSLATALFQRICYKDEKLLPLTKKSDSAMSTSPQASQGVTYNKEMHECHWLSPKEGFFSNLSTTSESESQLQRTLHKVGFKLLYSSRDLFQEFHTAGTNVREISPLAVLAFLKDCPSVGPLPCPIAKTAITSVVEVLCLLSYCMKAPGFADELFGTPLLLTEDNVLRRFHKNSSVFLSLFSDLLPTMHQLFLHHTLASVLQPIEKEIFKSGSSGVLKRFTISELGSQLPKMARGNWCETTNLIAWEASDGGPSKQWLQRLWEFIVKEHKKSSDVTLDPLRNWPILPTTSGMLAPVCKGKVILDLTPSDSWSSNQKTIVACLRKLKCHEIDVTMISDKGRWDVSAVLKRYLAYPNSSKDILNVLAFLMKETNLSGILSENEMLSILQFLQEDLQCFRKDHVCTSTIRRLPFFKSFHGEFVSLDKFASIFVIPEGLPTEESDVWMNGNNCVFLAPCPRLDRMYKELLGIDKRTHEDCYINFIFPKFSILQESTRRRHLNYVLRKLLLPHGFDLSTKMLNALKDLAFIPDVSGKLQKASHFYDPEVKVFAVMLPREAKPPEPFDKSSGWLNVLRKIGLKQKVTKDQFMAFANEVANQALNVTGSRTILLEKSKVLVTHLLNEEALHDAEFLYNLSTVKFVATQRASDVLCSIHKQHRSLSQSQDRIVPFTHFKDSVPHKYEEITWSTASLLPEWAVPCSNLPSLQVLKKPSLNQVINHVKNLSRCFSKHVDRDQPEPRRRLLNKIMNKIYEFLQSTSGCAEFDSLSSCSQECFTIGRLLSDVPCVVVEGGRVFVRGDQLAFDLDKQLQPYLYKVPREYGNFEHLFKRLGAVEKASPRQYAKLLTRLREECQGEKLNPNEMQVAKGAVYGLFCTLKVLQEQSKSENSQQGQNQDQMTDVNVLYLPNQEQRLKRSTDLVLFNCPEFKYRIKNPEFDFLDELGKYDVKFATPVQIVDLLPKHLRPQSLKEMVKEDLHPECMEKKCRADAEQKCQDTNRLRMIMSSPQLLDGIKRILKHQFQRAKLTADVCTNVCMFQTELSISCMETLTTHLVLTASSEPIPDSKKSRGIDCFVEQVNNKKHIFLKHGVDTQKVRRVICKELNNLTGCYIEGESWLHLQAILGSRTPDDISSTLDHDGVSVDAEATDSGGLEPELGSEVPEELHQLLVQFDNFFFREGEFVAYEREESEDQEPKYVFARIIRKLTTATSTKTRKDRTKRKQKGESNLLSRYLIDLGQEKKEVDVLDLYKIKRPSELQEDADQMEGETLSEVQELVPYEGSDNSTESARAAFSSQRSSEPSKPRSLNEALKEVKKALAEIWKLPEDKRRKAIKRLYLRWHPDKNLDMQEVATKVTQFIQNEVERLSKGQSISEQSGSDGARPDFNFEQWFQRARRQRSSYENFRRHNPGFYGFRTSSRRSYTPTNSKMSKLWLQQSREDLRSTKHLLTSMNPFNCLVCFQCHQIAEKALKAALYATSGVADRQLESHDLVKLAYDLSLVPEAPDVTEMVAKLSNYYDSTRYPHKHRPPRAPVDVYQDSRQVQDAFKAATDALNTIEQFLT